MRISSQFIQSVGRCSNSMPRLQNIKLFVHDECDMSDIVLKVDCDFVRVDWDTYEKAALKQKEKK